MGFVQCPGVDFLTSLVPPPQLPIVNADGLGLTDKGCLDVRNPLVQINGPHNFGLVPPGLFEGCNATEAQYADIRVDPSNGWTSLNFISAAGLQELVGKCSR